jgi:HD-like signal output (HDOD) protein
MLSRLFGKKTPNEKPAAPAPAASAPPAVPTLAGYEQELRATFTQQMQDRLSAITAGLSPVERATDAPRLLDALIQPAASMIRQPPAAAQRALTLTRDPDVGGAAIVKLIEKDPSLSQALLKFANSAYYATSSRSTVSVHGAVQRVGASGVQNVVLGTMVQGLLCRPGTAYQAIMDLVWAHMVRTAPIARALASEFGLHADAAFALGLLHDVGKLVIFDRLGTLRTGLRRDLRLPERLVPRVLNELHEPMGALAALEWSLGGMGARAIGTHHRSPVPDDPGLGSELLFLAERMDVALARKQAMDLAAWWEQGALLSRQERVERLLPAIVQTAEESQQGSAV